MESREIDLSEDFFSSPLKRGEVDVTRGRAVPSPVQRVVVGAGGLDCKRDRQPRLPSRPCQLAERRSRMLRHSEGRASRGREAAPWMCRLDDGRAGGRLGLIQSPRPRDPTGVRLRHLDVRTGLATRTAGNAGRQGDEAVAEEGEGTEHQMRGPVPACPVVRQGDDIARGKGIGPPPGMRIGSGSTSGIVLSSR